MDNKIEHDSREILKKMGDKGIVKWRNCNGDHCCTSKCPYKDTVLGVRKVPDNKKPSMAPGTRSAISDIDKPQRRKHVPPSKRNGGKRRGDTVQKKQRDYSTSICISNLSESTGRADVEELVKPFGMIQKQYLPKDPQTKLCQGFAYVHFKYRSEAARAISYLNGYGYDHLILNVDWIKPPEKRN